MNTRLSMIGVIQARMSSQRLPGKVLHRMGTRTVLERVVSAAKTAKVLDQCIIATSTDSTDDPIVTEAARLGVDCHRGDLHDVLSRFIGVLDRWPSDSVMRFTADCPLLDADLIRLTANMFRASNVDYVSTGLGHTLPRGLDVEVASTDALRVAADKATSYHRAHVTSFLYSNPDLFHVIGLYLPPDRRHYRLTLDTPEDYELLSRICEQFGDDVARLPDVIAWLDQHPDIANLNRAVVQKPLEEG